MRKLLIKPVNFFVSGKSFIISAAICAMIIAEHFCFTNEFFPETKMTLLMMLMFSSVIISRINVKELLKIQYLVGILPTFLLMYIKKAIPFDDRISFVVCALNIVVYGGLLSFGIKNCFIDGKAFQKKENKGIVVFLIDNSRYFWGILLLVFMVISKNEAVWPTYFLIAFLTNSLIPQDLEKRKSELLGIINGIIMGFAVIQGHAFVLRPYDENRYLGLYRNSNINAMFYLVVMVALLAMIYFLVENKASRWKRIIVLFLICCDFSLGLLAGSRTIIAIMSLLMVVCGLNVIFRLHFFEKKTLKHVAFVIGELVIVAVAGLIISFSAVRYLPPVFHHPIWYYGEYSEAKVHSFDPINSDKYCNPWMTTFGILRRFDFNEMKVASTKDLEKYSEDQNGNVVVRVRNYNSDGTVSIEETYDIHVAAIKERDGQRVLSYEDGIEPGMNSEHPAFVSENYSSLISKFLRIRSHIFRYYWSESSLWGSGSEWNARWITPTDVYDHAHNNVIEIAYCFGYISAMIYLAEFVAVAIILIAGKKGKCSVSSYEIFDGLMMISIFFLGITECTSFGFYFIWWMFFYFVSGRNQSLKKLPDIEHSSFDIK